MLHLTKVAFGVAHAETLVRRLTARGPGPVGLLTRNRPRRAEEVVGGSLYWIIKHRLVARSEVTGFEPAEGGRTHIMIAPTALLVRPVACRAHQGWRYLEGHDAPPDLVDGEDPEGGLPPALAGELVALGLL